MLEHIDRRRRAGDDSLGLLAPGGRLLLQVPTAPPASPVYDRATLTAQIERHGFAVESARHINWLGAVAGGLGSRPLLPVLRLEQRFSPSRGRALLVVARRV